MMDFSQQTNIGFRYVTDALETDSPLGRARVTSMRFFEPGEEAELLTELSNVKLAADTLEEYSEEYSRVERILMTLKDIRRSLESLREATLSEVELFELKRFCLASVYLSEAFAKLLLKAPIKGISITPETAALDVLDPEKTRTATFFIPDSASKELLSSRKDKRAIEEKLRRAQSGGERTKLMAERSAIAAREDAEERRLRSLICEGLRPYIDDMLSCINNIASLDFTLSRAKLAAKYGACMPCLTDNEIDMAEMINPRVRDSLYSRGRAFTPVSISTPAGATVITGANMGGKSVALKTLALNALLVKAGMLPFAKRARLPLFSEIFIVSEDMEDVDRGLSSFGAEIVQFNETLAGAESASGICMILLDEFARGTNPEEGAMIVRAVTRKLNASRHICALTTHYDGVAQFASAHYEVAGLRDMDMAEVAREIASSGTEGGADIIASHMNYGLYPATGSESCPRDARNICALLSLDPSILEDIR